jgi:hypothetical protein
MSKDMPTSCSDSENRRMQDSVIKTDMSRKIKLNDAQWKRLQELADKSGKSTPHETTDPSHRLMSNGLVASDQNGREYLTDQGARRLSQGR